jgi:PKD repeat protein
VVVTITNYGSEAVNLALNPAVITVNVSGASTRVLTITIRSGAIPVGGSLSWPVGVINLAIGGTHLITANVAVVGDGKARNDSRAFEIDVELVDQFPYNENFDNMATCSGSATAACDLSMGWSNDPGDDFDWHVTTNGTSSSSTGPLGDANGNGNYLYAETSSPNFGSKVAYANLPCVNIGGMTCPVLSFAYHMYGQTMGRMDVEVFDGQAWNTVYSLIGQQQTTQAASWEYAQVLLSNYTNIGIIKIRFKCTSGSNFYSDMAIDDVSLLDLATDFVLDAVASTNTATTCDIVDFSGNSNVGLLVQKWDVVGGIQGRDWDIIQGTVRDRNISIAFLKAGTYQVSFTGGALCGQSRKDTETIVITQGSPNVDFTANSTTGQIGLDVFTFTDLTSPDATDWTWRILPGTENVDYVFSSGNRNSQNPSVIFLRPGKYSVRLTAGTFCGASGEFKRDYFNISSLRPAAVGISNSEERLGEADHLSIHDMNILSVSPNPFSNYLQVNFVSLSEDMTEMKLSNMIGQTVHTEVIEDIKAGLQEVKLNLPENLSAGVYTLTVRQGTRTKTMKVIKE